MTNTQTQNVMNKMFAYFNNLARKLRDNYYHLKKYKLLFASNVKIG